MSNICSNTFIRYVHRGKFRWKIELYAVDLSMVIGGKWVRICCSFPQADFSGQHQPIWIEMVVKEYVTGWQRIMDIICTDPSMIVGYQIAFLKATLLKRFAHSPQSIDRGQMLC